MKNSTTDFKKPLAKNPVNLAGQARGNLAVAPKVIPETDPFKRLIIEWLDAGRSDGLSPRTLSDYQEKILKFWWWWTDYTHYSEKLGAHPKFVSRAEAREYASYLRENLAVRWGEPVVRGRESLSPASIASYGRSVKVFFNWLTSEDLIDVNPFANKGVKFSTRQKQERLIKTVEQEELAKLLRHMMDPDRLKTYYGRRDLAIICLLIYSGMRKGELLSMRLTDLDLKNNRCVINGKTGERLAMFSEGCRQALLNYLQARDEHDQGEVPQLWLTEDGAPLTAYGFASSITRLKERSGVNFHAHMLRHTFATNMARQNTSLFDLKEFMGHSNITTTQIYVRQNAQQLAAVYQKMKPFEKLDSVEKELRKRNGRPRQGRF
ncbi:MAG: tyrosine recombinase XerC [Chloroflexi bacterium]|nr:tyrosine recombinase XerC [Chloroflexota bacterium]